MLDKTFLASFPHNNDDNGFVVMATCSKPKSRGYVSIEKCSDDLADCQTGFRPIIDPQYLKDKSDVKCTRDAIKWITNFIHTSKPLINCCNPVLHIPEYEFCKDVLKLGESKPRMNNTKYLNCWIRMSAFTGYHPIGTTSRVIDNNYRVPGINKLRIIDASVIENPISGSTNAPLTALASYAIELILRDQFWSSL